MQRYLIDGTSIIYCGSFQLLSIYFIKMLMLCLKRQEKEQLKLLMHFLIVEEMMPDIPEVPEVTGGTSPPMTGLPVK